MHSINPDKLSVCKLLSRCSLPTKSEEKIRHGELRERMLYFFPRKYMHVQGLVCSRLFIHGLSIVSRFHSLRTVLDIVILVLLVWSERYKYVHGSKGYTYREKKTSQAQYIVFFSSEIVDAVQNTTISNRNAIFCCCR